MQSKEKLINDLKILDHLDDIFSCPKAMKTLRMHAKFTFDGDTFDECFSDELSSFAREAIVNIIKHDIKANRALTHCAIEKQKH